jgi:hypothetical protein
LSADPHGSDLNALIEKGRKLPDGPAIDTAAGYRRDIELLQIG